MSPLKPQSSNASFHYIGTELEIFAAATRWKRYVARQLRPFIHGHVLEVGAGIGSTTRALATGQEHTWTCLEPDSTLSATLQDVARNDSVLSRLPLKVYAASVADLPESAVFDTILYIDVLEHIEEDASQLRRAAECLSKKGHLLVLSPAHQWLWSPFDAAIGHYRRYSLKTLLDAGPPDCCLVRLRYLDSAGMLASLANRLVLRSASPNKLQVAFWDRFLVPMSRVLDPLLRYRVGKSALAIWRR